MLTTLPALLFGRYFAHNINNGGGSSIGNSSNHSHESHDELMLVIAVVSFLGGVASTSLMWWLSQGRSGRNHPERPTGWLSFEDLLESLDELTKRMRDEIPGSLDEWKARLVDMYDFKNRIGELPGLTRRQRWPWDRLRSKKGSTNETTSDGPTGTTSPTTPFALPPQVKSDYCIGSIFGLDVGGTLAKLVYFEQKSVVAMRDGDFKASLRERNYRTSASAQAVLLARRGSGSAIPIRGSESDQGGLRWSSSSQKKNHEKSINAGMRSKLSETDLEQLNHTRQESVPDNLQSYAETIHMEHNHIDSFTTNAAAKTHGEYLHERNTATDSMNGGHRTESTGVVREDGSFSESKSTIDSFDMKKSRSMLELSRDRAEALDHFYNFARRLESYREGVKDHKLSFYSRELQGEFHFIHFETRRMQQAMDLIRMNDLHLNIREMGATGGGAHKYAEKWEHELGIEMKKQPELDSLVAGMQFVLSTVVGECYSFRPKQERKDTKKTFGRSVSDSDSGSVNTYSVSSSCQSIAEESDGMGDNLMREDNLNSGMNTEKKSHAPDETDDESDDKENLTQDVKDKGSGDEWWWSRKVRRDAISYSSTYPYLVVMIGTGVSILRVDGPRKYERISGSTIGGGTYWGLMRLLTDVEEFDDVMRLAARGDPAKVDMMVGDIYGNNSDALEKLGLPASLVASSFGKLVSKDEPASGLTQEDLARALLLMITNNIGQVAYLNAKLSQTRRIYFVGNFLRENKISQRRLSYAIDFWSKGEMEALFLEHEGYFGALGAFLLSQGIDLCREESKPFKRSMSMHVKSENDSMLSEDPKAGDFRRSQSMHLSSGGEEDEEDL